MSLLTRLTAVPYFKVWGTEHTSPWYPDQPPNAKGEMLGEVWFETRYVPLLIKFLFTSQKLSVQVHPDDEYAREHHNSPGKTEMWHVLRATSDATVGVGLTAPTTKEQLRADSISGAIVKQLNWVPARPGDTFFLDAGTIHAVGENLAMCEVQQPSDLTYRLYDYGRRREMHLDHALAVATREPHGVREEAVSLGRGHDLLKDCPYFHVEKLTVSEPTRIPASEPARVYVVLEGSGAIDGQPFHIGEAWEAPAGADAFDIVSSHAVFLIASVPKR